MFKQKCIWVAVVAACSVGLAVDGNAQQQTPAQPQKVERVEVTGSNIKRTDTETASPIQVITREQIERSGATTITELLKSIPSSNAGSLSDIGASASFAPGASNISLRGLGSQATLVLLNGRRMATYGFANGAQFTFVNVDAIPTNAVDRIEILKDGASAIYGSEAMAGVVNIILRKDFRGAEVTSSYSIQDDYWDRASYRVSAALGMGDIARDRWNGFFNIDYFKRDGLMLLDRADRIDPRIASAFGTNVARSSFGYPGNYEFLRSGSPNATVGGTLRPLANCAPEDLIGGLCRYNQWGDIQLVNPSERGGVFARGTFELSPTLSAFAELGANESKTRYVTPPWRTPSFRVDPTFDWIRSTDSAFITFEPFVFPVGHPQNPFDEPVSIRYRFAERGSNDIDIKSRELRGLVGLKGAAGAWDWETGLLHVSSDTKIRYINNIHFDNLIAAVDSGQYVFGGNNSAAVLDSIYINNNNQGKTATTLLDARASTEIGRLPGGAIGLAVGAEYRRESFETISDPLFAAGNVVGYGSNSVDGSRNVFSAFAEASLPVMRNLETQLAVRWDRYSDYGNSVTPKAGFKFTPVKEVALRGTYAEGFRAPALTEISRSFTSFFLNGFADPVRCPVTQAENDCNGSVAGIAAPNPGIKPEKSRSYTAGIVFEPTANLNLSLDYYDISRRGEIGTVSATFVLENEARFPGRVVRGPRLADDPAGIPGPVRSISLEYQNLGRTTTTGLDFEVRANFALGEYGKLTSTTTFAHTLTYENSPTEADELTNYNGSYNQPRNRASSSLAWERGPWVANIGMNHTGKFSWSGASGGSCQAALTARGLCTIGEYTTFDFYTSYKGFKDLDLSLGVRNVGDKYPPADARGLSNQYNTTYHGLGGRFVSVGARYRFR